MLDVPRISTEITVMSAGSPAEGASILQVRIRLIVAVTSNPPRSQRESLPVVEKRSSLCGRRLIAGALCASFSISLYEPPWRALHLRWMR